MLRYKQGLRLKRNYKKKNDKKEKGAYSAPLSEKRDSIPSGWVSDYYLSREIFDLNKETEDFSEEELNALFAYIKIRNIRPEQHEMYELVENFRDSYEGDFPDKKDFIYYLVEEYGYPEDMELYFDYDQYATTLFINDYVYYDGHVFRRN